MTACMDSGISASGGTESVIVDTLTSLELDVQHDRCVIRGELALAGLAVDVRVDDGHWSAGQHVVDAHAHVLGEHSRAVVPVSEGSIVLAVQGSLVGQSPVQERLDPRTL